MSVICFSMQWFNDLKSQRGENKKIRKIIEKQMDEWMDVGCVLFLVSNKPALLSHALELYLSNPGPVGLTVLQTHSPWCLFCLIGTVSDAWPPFSQISLSSPMKPQLVVCRLGLPQPVFLYAFVGWLADGIVPFSELIIINCCTLYYYCVIFFILFSWDCANP